MFHLISKLVLHLCTLNINIGGIQMTSSGYILNIMVLFLPCLKKQVVVCKSVCQ